MPLRVTLELIPKGEESQKRKLVIVDIENDCTAHHAGAGTTGNYIVRAQGELREAGWDEFAHVRIKGLKRGDYLDTAIECLTALHSATMSNDQAQRPRTKGAGLETEA